MKVAVETLVFQMAVYRHYQRVSAEEGYNIPWSDIKRYGTGSKHKRILALQPRVQRGDFYVVDPLTEYDALETEMRFFPKPPHDDILDTLADLEQVFYNSPTAAQEPEPDYGTFDEIGRWMDGIREEDEVTTNPLLGW